MSMRRVEAAGMTGRTVLIGGFACSATDGGTGRRSIEIMTGCTTVGCMDLTSASERSGGSGMTVNTESLGLKTMAMGMVIKICGVASGASTAAIVTANPAIRHGRS
jgi:hypothetical protein